MGQNIGCLGYTSTSSGSIVCVMKCPEKAWKKKKKNMLEALTCHSLTCNTQPDLHWIQMHSTLFRSSVAESLKATNFVIQHRKSEKPNWLNALFFLNTDIHVLNCADWATLICSVSAIGVINQYKIKDKKTEIDKNRLTTLVKQVKNKPFLFNHFSKCN